MWECWFLINLKLNDTYYDMYYYGTYLFSEYDNPNISTRHGHDLMLVT